MAEYRRERQREHYETLKRYHEAGRVRLLPEALERIDRLLHKLRRAARRRRRSQFDVRSLSSASDDHDHADARVAQLGTTRKRSLSAVDEMEVESEDERAGAKRPQLAPISEPNVDAHAHALSGAKRSCAHDVENENENENEADDSATRCTGNESEARTACDELEETASLNDSTRCYADSESEDDSVWRPSKLNDDAELDVDVEDDEHEQSSSGTASQSSSDDEAEDGDGDVANATAYYSGPLPVSAKQRRSLLRSAGVSHIDARERDECNAIRQSREHCGCRCQVYCDPATCECAIESIRCQVDRFKFPCGCTRDGCRNPYGRVEFNPLRVRAHFLHTITRLRRVEADSRADTPNADTSESLSDDLDAADYASECNSSGSSTADRLDTAVSTSTSTSNGVLVGRRRPADERRFNSTESGSCRDCLEQQVGHPPSCNDVLLRYTRPQPHAALHHQHQHQHQHPESRNVHNVYVQHAAPAPTLFSRSDFTAPYAYHAHAHAHGHHSVAMNGVSAHQMPSHMQHHFYASPTPTMQHFSNGLHAHTHTHTHTHTHAPLTGNGRANEEEDECDSSDSDDDDVSSSDDGADPDANSDAGTAEAESACADEWHSDEDDDEEDDEDDDSAASANELHERQVTIAGDHKTGSNSSDAKTASDALATGAKTDDDKRSSAGREATRSDKFDQVPARTGTDPKVGTNQANESVRNAYSRKVMPSSISAPASPPPSPIFVSLRETSSIVASAMMLPFRLDDTQNAEKAAGLNSHTETDADANAGSSDSRTSSVLAVGVELTRHANGTSSTSGTSASVAFCSPDSASPTQTDGQMQSHLPPFVAHSNPNFGDYFATYYHAVATTSSYSSAAAPAVGPPTCVYPPAAYCFTHYAPQTLLRNANSSTNANACVYSHTNTNTNEQRNSFITPRDNSHMYLDYSMPVSGWPAAHSSSTGYSRPLMFSSTPTYATADSQMNSRFDTATTANSTNITATSTYMQLPHSVAAINCSNSDTSMMAIAGNANGLSTTNVTTNAAVHAPSVTDTRSGGTFEQNMQRHSVSASVSELANGDAVAANGTSSTTAAAAVGVGAQFSPVPTDTRTALNEMNDSTSSTLTFGEIIKESIVVDTVSAYA